ncbi:protein lava lamp-like isoform X4 [Osmia bicornis bicornis]|uniref:protein lava lamp-like isoform X4 n=1 Tax=Osmia bicornis bicornis TaxID=1437191 RepID=UPI001EAF083E|nr:protein lava lamp-like isoform X4 [Osmia bicornis bicornis]
MWSTSEEPPGTMEGDSSESMVHAKEKCEQNKNQLESLKEIMLKNKQSLKKKEEEVQEYARRLSKIKSRAKLSRRSKGENLPCKDVSHTSEETTSVDISEETIDDISQAKTAKAKSTLLQKKLAENRKVFEQRNKEITETKRAVEEKVEAIRQQLEEKDITAMGFQKDQLPVAPIKPVMISSDIMSPKQIESIEEKENQIAVLNKKILELEATVIDLQENLKEKDSVIESKTRAVTLMSADLSKKGKTTLDTLEDTKDEMRTMQEHFILLETSLKNKNESLLEQLQGRDNKIAELEDSIKGFEQQLSQSSGADVPRSTLDTLLETKEAMKSMQENFVLVESSLKAKNDHLLEQLGDYELKLAEANERIFKLESGIGIIKDPTVDDLQYKLEKLEHSNKQLQDEKYELQKNIAELQDKILNLSVNGNNGALMEKDNRIVELENLIEELKQSNKLLEEESKAELQQKLADLTLKNEEYSNKIADLEGLVHELEEQKSDIAARLSDESSLKGDEKVAKLTKELEELNKSMIKIKAQHRSKIKNLQKQLENVKKVSDTNAELVRLGNQVALLEEEKGNLQLSLVDFDELKELHIAKQEVSSLEAENAESENLRVTAEMKIVDLEEQLEAMNKLQNDNKLESSSEDNHAELLKQVEALTQENAELYSRISKLEEKGTSETGSTESFEAIQELDKSDLLKKIEDLMHKNNELTLKVSRYQEKENSHAGSTEWLETMNERDKNELLKKVEQLTQENTDLAMKLSRMEEKGSSDTGSTESFERIPEHNESMTKIELLTQENNELVIKFTKLKEQLENTMEIDAKLRAEIEILQQADKDKSSEVERLTAELRNLAEEKDRLQKQIESLIVEKNELAALHTKEEDRSLSEQETVDFAERSKRSVDVEAEIDEEKDLLEKEVKGLERLRESTQDLQIDELTGRIEELLKENERVLSKLSELETYNDKLKENLTETTREKEELQSKINDMSRDHSVKEMLELEKKDDVPEKEEMPQSDESSQQTESMIVASLEREIEECKKLIAEQTGLIEEMKLKLANKEEELEEKGKQLTEYEASGKKAESLENELKEIFDTVDEWKHKCIEMQEKMEKLEAGKASIEEGFKMLQNENKILLEENKEKDAETDRLKQQLQDTVTTFESKVQEQLAAISEKENEIGNLKQIIEDKDQELHAKYTELQNKMIAIDSLQDECNNCKMLIQERNNALASMSDEVANLNNAMKSKEDEIYTLRKHIDELSEKLDESKPLKDYNELLEQLKNKDMILDELHCRINATTKENSNLSEKLKSLSQHNNNIQSQLAEKQREFVDMVAAKELLETLIAETKKEKDEAERRIWDLQSVIDYYMKFVEDLQGELKGSYKHIEQLKLKHTEDVELQNQRLENLIEELNSKTQECETLRDELEEKERLVGRNITEEVKVALEARIVDLAEKLKESEEKIQSQLEKMKKLAANLKKKTTVCQELEGRVTELEEKWTTEKDEKEAKNKQIQDVEIAMREKDNRITDLEEKLTRARNENADAFKNIEELTSDLSDSKEKITLLTGQIEEMEREIVKLRADLESRTAELGIERESKGNIISDYDSYKQSVIRENERKQVELDEVKEKARELSVRMQVMEAEYVEQLASIKNLTAENGLLLSKQTQINEKLENAEKESEERRLLIEQMRRVTTEAVTESTQTTEEESTEEERKTEGAEQCDRCKQCQTLVQTLELKLQEREAEIENLDNELANSIGNFVRMNQNSMRNRSLEDPYNDLLFQYNSLISSHEEVKAKLDEASKENKQLIEKIEQLQSMNVTLEETVTTTEQSIERQREDLLNSDLAKEREEREAELLNLQREIQTLRERVNELEQQLNSQTISLESAEDRKKDLRQEIESLRSDRETNDKLIEDLRSELEGYRNQSGESVEKPIAKREATFDQQENAPRLFDASKIFGSFASDSDLLTDNEAKRLQALLEEKEARCSNLTQEMNHLQKLMMEERSQMSQNYSQCVEELEISRKELTTTLSNLEVLERTLSEKDKQIDALNLELQNLNLRMMEQQNDTKESQLEELRTSLNSTKEALDAIIVEREQRDALLESYKLQVTNLEAELKNSTDSELIQELESRVSCTTKERDLLQLQVNDLSRSMEELKYSMGVELEKIGRERDEAKEMVANLTRALEDAYKQSMTSTITDTSTKESTPLEEVSRDQLEPGSPVTKAVVEEAKQGTASTPFSSEVPFVDDGTGWDAEKLVDEESWGWDAEEAQLVGEHVTASLIPSMEMQLRARVDDLEDRIKDMEKERDRMLEESKAAQLRNAKMIKKLKEYKVQVESLQQQLKTQKSSSDFYELDSAIEEELKCQISKLEKSLSEVREELKNTVAEKEALTKRLDVVVSANERYMEMKERQDMDMEVLRIRNKELSDKIEALDKKLQSGVTAAEDSEVPRGESVVSGEEDKPVPRERVRKRSVDPEDYESLCKKYREEIDDLKEEMEALASENDLLQHFLEEQKVKMSSLEKKRTAEENESIQIVDDLNKRISELQAMLSKSREEYELLRKQYEQSLMDANDQVTAMRQNTDFLKEEAREKIGKLEMEVADLRKQLEIFESSNAELQKHLQEVFQEKTSLEERLTAIMASSEKQLSSMNASMAEVTDLLNIRIQEVADLKQELQRQYVDHEEAKTKLQETVEGLDQELGEKRQQLERLKQSLSEKENEFVQQQSVETVSALVSQATQELAQKHAIEVEEKEKEIQSLRGKLSALETAVNEYSSEKQGILARLDEQQQELQLLRQDLTEKNSSLVAFQANLTSILSEKERELFDRNERIDRLTADNQSLLETIGELQRRLYEFETTSIDTNGLTSRIQSLETSLLEKESDLARYAKESNEYHAILENNRIEIEQLRADTRHIDELKSELTAKAEQMNRLNVELEATREALGETRQILNEKTCLLEKCNRALEEKDSESSAVPMIESNQPSASNIVDGFPLFRMTEDNHGFQQTIDGMQAELEKKQEEIEHLKYVLNENTYPGIIREMQDTINCLYDEKAELKSSLDALNEKFEEKAKEIESLTESLKAKSLEVVSKEQTGVLSRERASMQDQERIVGLQNELHAKEQEINEMKYVLAEKDSQLSLQASMEPQSDDFELREMVQRLTGEVYGKEQEVQQLKSIIAELQTEVSRLQEFERLSEETKDAIEKLGAEKEQARLEAEEYLKMILEQKETEIDEIKQRLSVENQRMLDELQLRDRDVENLKKQLEELSTMEQTMKDKLQGKEEDLARVSNDLAEKERRLAELSITKDAELHNLNVLIHEKEARIEELMLLSDEEEKQLKELRNVLEARETEINSLKKLLEDKVKEFELIQNVLKKDVSVVGASTSQRGETSDEDNKAFASQELDLALYMLHQRDVRCEELTHELMQLLEERDTLQLRLSNAIRVNEELRRMGGGPDVAPRDEASTSVSEEPMVEHPSPSKSEGPVEIAKEAIDAPIGEDKEALALKLSQLHTVSHTKDVRLRDERELRHTQQMSLLAHKDVLSTLPPEAAARLVNANYTLSRDVQSQSSVLLNWLWGKSTPKVVHM